MPVSVDGVTPPVTPTVEAPVRPVGEDGGPVEVGGLGPLNRDETEV